MWDLYEFGRLDEIDGVTTAKEIFDYDINVTRVKIRNKKAAAALGKGIGDYITIEMKSLRVNSYAFRTALVKIITTELQKIIKVKPTDSVLMSVLQKLRRQKNGSTRFLNFKNKSVLTVKHGRFTSSIKHQVGMKIFMKIIVPTSHFTRRRKNILMS